MTDAYSPISELNLLKEFSDGPGDSYFSDGFEFYEYGRPDAGLVEWLSLERREEEARSHLDRLTPFAQATASGSFYALWHCDDRADLATLPVVRFGDEGHLDIIDGLRNMFRLLAIDDEWFSPWDEEREADPDEEHSPGHEAYVVWLEETFGLTPPTDAEADEILGSGGKKYGTRFVDWLEEFASEGDDFDPLRKVFADS
ncbi:hypothetical protein AA958_27580 [Streptomyces sp. CNQ-509]|uniref:hypothetical protein n=1 Tax=unclassified Streptomyces TaxID=2593676 RepID=UPI00062DD360|nr:hypothetical protein [Streptomyces sp. CNQ-509]AKH85370.1 hypothetical protein AA958_27580 [Streptomyces sp. CNQ-509]